MDHSKNTMARLQVGDVARFWNRKYLGRFMVVGRSPEGKIPGFTKIHYEEDQTEESLTWSLGNMAVEYLGRGEFIPQQVRFPQSTNTGEFQ